MQLFNHLVGLEKKQRSKNSNNNNKVKEKPEKKVKIDLQGLNEEDEQVEKPTKNEEFKCIANNVNKILYLKYE